MAAIAALLVSAIAGQAAPRAVYVLLYNPSTPNEGIHTIKTDRLNTVLMFSSQADAQRFATQLGAQNFPQPVVEAIGMDQVLAFCRQERYQCQLIPVGTPITPPKLNVPPQQRDYQPSPKPAPARD